VATVTADEGAPEYELMAWFGWKDPQESETLYADGEPRKAGLERR
jgi:hypothetical protein